jgi:hypothetical protein
MSCTRNVDATSAKLCAVLTVLEARGDLLDVVGQIDTDTSGTTPAEIVTWFADHKTADLRLAA